MFIYKKIIHLRQTDATGALYFTEQLNIGLEAFEGYLFSKGIFLHEILAKGAFLLPIVHAETDFLAPLYAGDEIEVTLHLEEKGVSSFSLRTSLVHCKKEKEVGKNKIIHVAVSKETGKALPIPASLEVYLRELGAF